MINCLLIHVTRTRRNQAIRQEHPVQGDVLSIGRAAECKIHLPDHRVGLHHANIRHRDDGRIYMEANAAPINTGDSLEQSVELTAGRKILLGPYEFVVEEVVDNEHLTLSYELVHPVTESIDVIKAAGPLSLSETMWPKRTVSQWLAAIIALIFIILPASYALSPTLHKLLENPILTPDESWKAGNLSPGHRALSTKCNTCHEKPFTAVRDQACINCHKSIAQHIAAPELNKMVFKGVRCSQCHIDHRGLKGLVRHDSQQCVTCHGKIKTKNPLTKLADITDFSTDHPPLRLTVSTGRGKNETERVAQTKTNPIKEHSGLKYSHQVHFDKALIMLPGDKTRDILCADCHVPDDAGIGFVPMTMEQTCQQSKCHAMQFDPPAENRGVPHGSEQSVMTTLREYFASRALSRVSAGNDTGRDLQLARKWAANEADKNAKILFTSAEEGTCLECHEVSSNPKNTESPWKVAAVNIPSRWLPHSKFPHEKHMTDAKNPDEKKDPSKAKEADDPNKKCTECHDVMKSDKSSDVNIPTIEKCRECHVGSNQAKTRVSSTCDTCHNFHNVLSMRSHPIIPVE